MAKAAFNRKKILLTSKLDLNLRKKVVKCYIWIIALHGPEIYILWEKFITNRLKVLKCGAEKGLRISVVAIV
jgi:hypothetical protein